VLPGRREREPTEAENKVTEEMRIEFKKYLQEPGPQLVVCDEGHTVKVSSNSFAFCVPDSTPDTY
jgi:hypothetical protein